MNLLISATSSNIMLVTDEKHTVEDPRWLLEIWAQFCNGEEKWNDHTVILTPHKVAAEMSGQSDMVGALLPVRIDEITAIHAYRN